MNFFKLVITNYYITVYQILLYFQIASYQNIQTLKRWRFSSPPRGLVGNPSPPPAQAGSHGPKLTPCVSLMVRNPSSQTTHKAPLPLARLGETYWPSAWPLLLTTTAALFQKLRSWLVKSLNDTFTITVKWLERHYWEEYKLSGCATTNTHTSPGSQRPERQHCAWEPAVWPSSPKTTWGNQVRHMPIP